MTCILLQDLPKAIRQVSGFLDKPLSEEQIGKLAEHLHIDNFRKAVNAMDLLTIKGVLNEDEQGFVRKGRSKFFLKQKQMVYN